MTTIELKKVWVTMEPITEGEKKGWFAPTGFHLAEPDKWYECYTVNDPEQFIEHMKKYQSILGRALDQDEYEKICIDNEITPWTIDQFRNAEYGMKYGDFGMDHYHTHPDNRKIGIANTIHQRRYWAIASELNQKKGTLNPVPDYPDGRKLGCGHVVYYKSHVMTASLGLSCADCYDRMSD